MADVTQTDVSRPSALPTARLRPSAAQQQAIVDQSSAEYLDFVEEEWNKKVDVEVETLVVCLQIHVTLKGRRLGPYFAVLRNISEIFASPEF